MSMQSPSMTALLVELVEELSRAHTESTLVEAAFRALSRHLPIVAVAVRLDGPEGLQSHHAGRQPAEALRPGERSTELLLSDDGVTVGRATLCLVGEAAEGRMLDDIARILSAGLRQVRTLARVASLSRRAHAQNRELGDSLRAFLPDGIVAEEPSMRRIFHEVVPVVARQTTTVLLLGETGCGKEVVASRIHEVSPRARRPYVRINCGAIPPGLLESALFGHERGAFTGAVRAHAGVFERAHEGTLLLDEVGELSPEAQVRLLRALETGEIERVGAGRSLRVDVRIVAATHRDLEAMVAAGQFRRDLYYRLNVFPIAIPPLRQRRADIEPLAREILARLSQRFGERPPALDVRTVKRLQAHAWPGNVRELENVIERSLILSRGGSLQVDLPAVARSTAAPMRFEDAARRAIEDAIAASGGRIYGPSGAAAILGLKPTTLASKMKRLRIREGRRR
jgi:transcriptional regulator with GAF, ATPase, and Fis domain